MDEFERSADHVISLSAKQALLGFFKYNSKTIEEMK